MFKNIAGIHTWVNDKKIQGDFFFENQDYIYIYYI